MKNLSVIGLGKLGACIAACLSARGFKTLGVDINQKVVDLVNDGKSPHVEPRLQEMISAGRDNLSATKEIERAISDSDVSFLITPTPSRRSGHFSDKYMRTALAPMATALGKSDKDYHLFVITSTLSPGNTEDELVPLIEKLSGRKLNKGFGVCYSPEFIALGSVITDFLNPDTLLVGESDKRAGDMLSGIYEKTCENEPYTARMSIISAEITKISLNSYITLKISFANTLANICQNVPGAELDLISKALGSDRRISPYYLKGGPSFGGPCFPRDNRAFISFAKKYSADPPLAMTTDIVNQHQVEHIHRLIMDNLGEENRSVSVLGLAYKPDTPVIEESFAIKLIEMLSDEDVEVTAYDPIAMDNTQALFGEQIYYASSAKDCVAQSAISVVTLPLEEFKDIDSGYFRIRPSVIIDCWRFLDEGNFGDEVSYIALGKAK
ncbi:MAG: UDP-glucose/GDP-mannose dehydrogenase family protein [Thermodesulfovibrionales bacterium]|nr:UDP-glucose/GDP-mannose dehydrogenase family protein [Thermodesulfovibrionales bacterium]